VSAARAADPFIPAKVMAYARAVARRDGRPLATVLREVLALSVGAHMAADLTIGRGQRQHERRTVEPEKLAA
jgi:hypothetical protein